MESTLQMRPVEYMVLQVRLPGGRPEKAGVLLLDKETDKLYVKLRRDLDSFEGEEAGTLTGLEESLLDTSKFWGGAKALSLFSESLSGVLVASDPLPAVAADPEARLRRLYRENVNQAGAVPIVRLSAAAGGLSEEQLPGELIGTADTPPGVRLAPGMFIARVEGRSMEPLIPDGSLCLFRPHGGGTRNGQKLLVEKFGTFDSTAQFTVKVYRSEKRMTEDGDWEHTRIRMIPLNPDFEEWNLTSEEFRVVGEFVCVLPPEE